MQHVTNQKSPHTSFMNMTTSSSVAFRITQSESYRTHLGFSRIGNLHHEINLKNLQELHDAMSTWTRISKDSFQHLIKPRLWNVKALLEAKEGSSQYYIMLLLKCWVSVNEKWKSPWNSELKLYNAQCTHNTDFSCF